jgi:RNA polymerase sigma-70 factor (ECF subfamily)
MRRVPGKPDSRDTTSTSRSLLRRMRADDPAAWERLVTLYAPLVWFWCERAGLPRQDAADVAQEVFHAVASHVDQFHGDRPGDTFRGWLRRITANKVHDHFRKRRHQPDAAGGTAAKVWWSEVPDQEDDLEEVFQAPAGDQLLFRRALELIRDSFEEKTWRAFWRVVVDERLPQEAAKELGMSPAAVRVAKCRVLQRLRKELGDIED